MSVVDELEGSDLLERRRDPSDRRKHQVHLTSAGREVLARADTVAQEVDAAVLASIGSTDRDAFMRGLREVVTFFDLDL